jgi:hypothetical protein
MVVALNVDYENITHWTEAVENAELVNEIPGAPIVNIDANFLVPEGEQHLDKVFPRLNQMHEMFQLAEKQGSLISVEDIPQEQDGGRPYRRPDFSEEWRLLRKAWSLTRRGQDQLANKKITAATELFYKSDPLTGLMDWIWRFTLFIGQPSYEAPFRDAVEAVRQILSSAEFGRFAAFYQTTVGDRGERYLELMKAYFDGYDDFGQVYFRVVKGMEIPPNATVGSVNFDQTRMFYGNAFEAFASSVDVLAYLNNIRLGRPFDTFAQLTQKEYLRLDKANRFDAFATFPEFAALCQERNNQIRNASHHGNIRIESRPQTVRYRTGKGSAGQEERLSYVDYLARSTKLFLQAMTLFRIEIMMCHWTSMRPPL